MGDACAVEVSPAHAVGSVIDIGPALAIGDEVALFVVRLRRCRSAIGGDAGILVKAIGNPPIFSGVGY